MKRAGGERGFGAPQAARTCRAPPFQCSLPGAGGPPSGCRSSGAGARRVWLNQRTRAAAGVLTPRPSAVHAARRPVARPGGAGPGSSRGSPEPGAAHSTGEHPPAGRARDPSPAACREVVKAAPDPPREDPPHPLQDTNLSLTAPPRARPALSRGRGVGPGRLRRVGGAGPGRGVRGAPPTRTGLRRLLRPEWGLPYPHLPAAEVLGFSHPARAGGVALGDPTPGRLVGAGSTAGVRSAAIRRLRVCAWGTARLAPRRRVRGICGAEGRAACCGRPAVRHQEASPASLLSPVGLNLRPRTVPDSPRSPPAVTSPAFQAFQPRMLSRKTPDSSNSSCNCPNRTLIGPHQVACPNPK